MRKALSVAVLLFALTCSTYAGDMPNGSPEPPPPTPNAVQEEQGANGEMQNDEADSSLTEMVLNLLEGVLALL